MVHVRGLVSHFTLLIQQIVVYLYRERGQEIEHYNFHQRVCKSLKRGYNYQKHILSVQEKYYKVNCL